MSIEEAIINQKIEEIAALAADLASARAEVARTNESEGNLRMVLAKEEVRHDNTKIALADMTCQRDAALAEVAQLRAHIAELEAAAMDRP